MKHIYKMLTHLTQRHFERKTCSCLVLVLLYVPILRNKALYVCGKSSFFIILIDAYKLYILYYKYFKHDISIGHAGFMRQFHYGILKSCKISKQLGNT